MTLKRLAESVGITAELPKWLEPIYDKAKNTEFLFGVSDLSDLQKRFSVFDEDVYEAVKLALSELFENEALLGWAAVCVEAVRSAEDRELLYGMPMPPFNGSAANDLFPLFPLLPYIEKGILKYQERGFSYDESISEIRSINGSVLIAKSLTGKYSFTKTYYAWCTICVFADIFRYGVLNFEISVICDPIVVLKNKKSGEHVILMTEGDFHRSGHNLLSAGLSSDTEGAFSAEFYETEAEYVGHTANLGYADSKRQRFSKEEWEKVLEKGDPAISLHIPRGVDVSRESVIETVSGGMRIVKERFSEKIKFAFCRSWLLSPNVSQCLNPDSKIIAFENVFHRYPIQSTGKELMAFLFRMSPDNYEDLPEETSLQRKIKRIYLDGGYIYAGAGVITDEEFYK